MPDTNFDFSFLVNCSEDLTECFRMYLEDINPFVVEFEVEKGEFPIEIQNEIRAIYGHLCKAASAGNSGDAQENVKKIKSHSKRALLDCFKYCCIVCIDKYDDFMKRYEGVDLSNVDNGKFLPDIENTCRTAKDQLIAAKEMELKGKPDEELFFAYQQAYNAANKIKDKLIIAEEKATYFKRKATRRDVISKISFIVGIVSFVVGALLGILGLIF